MHISYDGWEYLGMSMFEFGHSYASRVVSLFAMFIMAIAMFELLPELHRHILRLLESVGLRKRQKQHSQSFIQGESGEVLCQYVLL